VPTADERILPGGTGYLTDAGMTGCYDSVVGLDTQAWLQYLVQKLPVQLEVAEGEGILCAVMLGLDEASGRCRHIERLRMSEFELTIHNRKCV
jgi:hypothetical protein